ncbi:MAG: DUF3857 domain-containing protein [Bacteroidota bacterium]
MKTKCLLLLGLFVGQLSFANNTIPANNPSYAVGNIPDSLLDHANTVIRFSHEQYEVHSIGKATEKIKAVITVLNSKSEQDDLRVYYDQFTKVGKIKARLYDANGDKIREIKKDEVNDYAAFDGFSIYNDLRLKHVDFTYGNYPYTIEYEYEVNHNGLQSYGTWAPQNYKTSVEKSIFELTLPTDMDFRYQAFNVAEQPVVSNDGAKKRNSWQLFNKKVVPRETNAPDTYQPLPVLRTLPNDFEVDGYRGNMESWQAFGQFMYELNDNRDNLSPAMVQKVKSLTANATTNEERIAALYHYLQENMRYVSVQLGIGGWQTFDADYVEKNKYGDCKALTNFMKGMLKTAGIKAYASLITAGDQRMEIKEDFTVPYFNHVILNIPEENIWLECTSTSNPVNYLGTNTANRPTLLITEKGGILTKTPPISDNLQKGQTTITLDATGSAKVECATELTGKLHEVIRALVNNYAQEDQEKWFTQTQDFPTFTFDKLDLSVDRSAPLANCNYAINVQRYASKAGKRLFVPLNLVNTMGRTLPKDANRQQPIEFELGYEDTDEVTFQLPASHKVESLPKNLEPINSPYGSYSVEIIEKDHSIIYKRHLKINPVQVPASEYNALRTFYKKIAKMDKAKLVLVRRPA